MDKFVVVSQVEEEANASEIIEKLKLAQKEKGIGFLYMLDRELAQRVFTPPVKSAD